MAEQEIGVVTHYFDKIEVAAITLTKGGLKTGERIHFHGHSTDFRQVVGSMQIEHATVSMANLGDEIGLKVDQPAHEHDRVFKIAD
jgi:hypothetical protein